MIALSVPACSSGETGGAEESRSVELTSDAAVEASPGVEVASDAGTPTVLVSSESSKVSSEVSVTNSAETVLWTRTLSTSPGDRILLKAQVEASQNVDGVARYSAWLECDSRRVSPIRSKDLVRSRGNHHGSVWMDGQCASSSATTTLRIIVKGSGTSMTFHDGPQSFVSIEHYSSSGRAGLLASKIYTATHSGEPFSFGVNAPYRMYDLQKLAVPASAGQSVYYSSQATASYDPDRPDTIDMFGFRTSINDVVTAASTENPTSEVYRITQSAMGMKTVAAAAPPLSFSTQVYGADGTGLLAMTDYASIQALVFDPAAGFPLSRSILTTMTADAALAANQDTVLVGSTVHVSAGGGLIRVGANAQLSSSSTSRNHCRLRADVKNSAGSVVARSTPNLYSVAPPYRAIPLRSEVLVPAHEGTYTVESIATCTGTGVTATPSGGWLFVDVFTS
jgi:hypothetical protein